LDTSVKQQVRDFYDQIGWQEVGEGLYQNARYEDLRPVSREYIHKCHLRIARHLRPHGRYLLDAGSGPIQYPEYLVYSQGYTARLCVDISLVALQEARQRIGDRATGGHGFFVVADVANLPFEPGSFDGVVALHTLHHLPEGDQARAYHEIFRVLVDGSTAVVVNGWDSPPLMRLLARPLNWVKRIRTLRQHFLAPPGSSENHWKDHKTPAKRRSKGTFVSKHNVAWLKREIGSSMPLEVLVWRSVSVRFLRLMIHPRLGGRAWLRLLFWLEELFPVFFGKNGQYPLILIHKPLKEGIYAQP
jgi:SAM-dependent methyltransferase